MIDLNYIKSFYSPNIAANPKFDRHLLKEYVELLSLDFLNCQTEFTDKICFIGGTNLRLVKGIPRFSEDLDFDCKSLTGEDFKEMTDRLADYLRSNGLNAEIREKESERLSAFRRSIYFPQLLFDLQLSGHREERFLMKVEAQDQGIDYQRRIAAIDRCGFHINMPVPPDDILLSMKIAALLARAKGRDFYDTMFLLQQTKPSYEFLAYRCGISNREELLSAIEQRLSDIDLELKTKDFRHLLLNESDASRILDFPKFIQTKI